MYGRMTVMERPQHVWMRVAVGIHLGDLESVKTTYDLLSLGKLMHATPTLYNCGTLTPQMSSCYLIPLKDTLLGERNATGSWENISDEQQAKNFVGSIGWATLQIMAISKNMGGIGIWVHDIRAAGSMIRSSGRDGSGLLPLLKTFESEGRYINQGGRRNGSIAVYCEPWHADIMTFLEMRQPKRKEEMRALDLFYALWIPDLFMARLSKALEQDSDTGTSNTGTSNTGTNTNKVMWSLMCPDESRGLSDVYGKEFEELYTRYEREGKYRRQIPIMTIWKKILESQKETGTPYMMYKDHVNKRNNQSNLGIIKSSNLCVSGDTKILVKKDLANGNEIWYEEVISEVCGETVQVWNGSEYSEVVPIQTNTNQELLSIKFVKLVENCERVYYRELKCTRYHKFYLADNPLEAIACENLKPGMKLVPFKFSWNSEYIYLEVVSITAVPGLHDTYCFNEPKRHMGIFNGVLTGNCTEIMEYTNPDEGMVAVCNLASIPVNAFHREDGTYDYEGLGKSVEVALRNIDKIIDINYYPTRETEKSNKMTRPAAIGIQGWQDLLYLRGYPFDSEDAMKLNREIFETMYYYAVRTSVELAKVKGAYPKFAGSPSSKGKFQFDLWNEEVLEWNSRYPDYPVKMAQMSAAESACGVYPWDELRKDMQKYGLRNSLMISNMPTASTAQIQGNVEAFEPITSNLYVRRVLSGEFKCVNKYMQRDFIKRGLWTKDVRNKLVEYQGSVQDMEEIPRELRDLYKTAFEVKQRNIIRQASERSPFVDQSQSMNVFVTEPNDDIMTTIHLTGWRSLLKTGMYYLRRGTTTKAIQFTVDPTTTTKKKPSQASSSTTTEPVETVVEEEQVCRRDNPDCAACSS
jgi:ribonucleotide reductase alpha subunit